MTAASAEPLLEVQGLSVDIATRNGPARVIDGVSLTVGKGETLGVVGESGCGKSLTMLSLIGLLPNRIAVSGGSARFEGQDLLSMGSKDLRKVRGGRIGFVFQDPMTSLNPVMRIGDQLAEPLRYHLGYSREKARERAAELLQLVGIPGPRERLAAFPHELSGGMRQRVMIAIGLACNPKLLIADEPTTALDVTIQAQIVDLVKDLRAKLDMAIVWITHDLALIAGLVDRVVVLYAGTVVEDAQVDTLYNHPLHPYTRGLLASIPRLESVGRARLSSIGGAPPEPGRRPAGCPFAPRCPLVMDVCRQRVPKLEPVGRDGEGEGEAGHRVACFAVHAVEGVAA